MGELVHVLQVLVARVQQCAEGSIDAQNVLLDELEVTLLELLQHALDLLDQQHLHAQQLLDHGVEFGAQRRQDRRVGAIAPAGAGAVD